MAVHPDMNGLRVLLVQCEEPTWDQFSDGFWIQATCISIPICFRNVLFYPLSEIIYVFLNY